jgi:hypothetical protein
VAGGEGDDLVSNFDPTSPDTTLILPPVVWMELKCKRPDPRAIVKGREQIVVHRPRVPYKHEWENGVRVFTPLTMPDPPWLAVRDFVMDSYAMECYSLIEGGESFYMWDLAGQINLRAGEQIIPGICRVAG